MRPDHGHKLLQVGALLAVSTLFVAANSFQRSTWSTSLARVFVPRALPVSLPSGTTTISNQPNQD
jgi:hypothetical protein